MGGGGRGRKAESLGDRQGGGGRGRVREGEGEREVKGGRGGQGRKEMKERGREREQEGKREAGRELGRGERIVYLLCICVCFHQY